MKLLSISIALVLCVVVPGARPGISATPATYSYTPIAAPGASQTLARGINDDTNVVGQFYEGVPSLVPVIRRFFSC